MRTNTFLGFRNGKLVSVVTTTMDNYNDAVDCDCYVKNPQNVKKTDQRMENFLRLPTYAEKP